jgi:hypothetical protein
MSQKEIEEKQREDECDHWFNQARPMIMVRWTWQEKRLTRKEGEDESNNILDGAPMGRMLVNGGASVTIMPWTVLERLGHKEKDMKKTSHSMSGFAAEPAEAKGIVCKELTVCIKTILTALSMVDVKGSYNILLGCNWIHGNGCVRSTLHQCVVQ